MPLDNSLSLDVGEERQPDQRGFEMFPVGSREYKKDIKRRNGGLMPNRKSDIPMIKQTIMEIETGRVTDDQARAFIHRNPGSASLLQAALQRRQQEQEIRSGATQFPQDNFGQPVSENAGVVSGGLRDDASLLRDPATRFNPEAAINLALKSGRIDLAEKFKKFLPKEDKTSSNLEGSVVKKVVGKDGVERYVRLTQADLARGVPTFKRISNKDATDIDTGLAVAKNLAIPLLHALNPKISAKKRAELKSKGIDPDPNAVGSKGFLPDVILNRLDPKGTSTRQLASNLSSAILKLRSGAQVSDKEYARLSPFLLTGKETPAQALKKAQGLVREYLSILRERNETFSSKNGFVPHKGLQKFIRGNKNVQSIKASGEKGSNDSGGLTKAQQQRLNALRKKQGR